MEASIPPRLRLALLRDGLRDDWVQPHHFGFEPIGNPHRLRELPDGDRLFRITRVHCDCWSTLGTPHAQAREVDRWHTIFRSILTAGLTDRLGLIVQVGSETDRFPLAGPVTIAMANGMAPFMHLQEDTLYELIS